MQKLKALISICFRSKAPEAFYGFRCFFVYQSITPERAFRSIVREKYSVLLDAGRRKCHTKIVK